MIFVNEIQGRGRRGSRILTVNSAMKYIAERTTKLKSKLSIPMHANSILPKASLKNLKKLQRKNSFYSLILSLIVIIFSFYENERYYSLDSTATTEINIIRFTIVTFVFVHIGLIYRYYKRKLQIKILYREVSLHTTLIQSPCYLRYFLGEVFISMVFTPPFLSFTISFTQLSIPFKLNVSDILFIFAFLRIYQLAKFLFEYSIHNSIQAKFYTDLQYIKNPYKFSIKSIIKENPILYLIFVFGISTVLLGILLRIYERSMPDSRFAYIWNGIWLISVTQSTIGYGDIVPDSHLGRIICVYASFFGTFMYSYMIMYVKNLFNFKENEAELFNKVYQKCTARKRLAIHAIKFLQSWWRMKLSRKNKQFSFEKLARKHFYLLRFKYHRVVIKGEKQLLLDEQIESAMKASEKSFLSINRHLDGIKQISCDMQYFKHEGLGNSEKLFAHRQKLARYSDQHTNSVQVTKVPSGNSSRVNLKCQSDKAFQNLRKLKISPPFIKIDN